jgi:hypothetical protein
MESVDAEGTPWGRRNWPGIETRPTVNQYIWFVVTGLQTRIAMSLDEAFQNVIGTVPDCVASGCVDMSTGILLGAQTTEEHPQAMLDLVVAATSELFGGAGMAAVEDMFRKAKGPKNDNGDYYQEIIVFSNNLVHVFLRTRKNPEHMVVFVCRKTANPGIVLAKTRMVLDSVADRLAS